MAHHHNPRHDNHHHRHPPPAPLLPHHGDHHDQRVDRSLPHDTRLPPNRFVGPYLSNWLTVWTKVHPEIQALLQNVNCSHFSTRGQAPTLLELKQHAQALLILIKAITVSNQATSVDGAISAAALTTNDLVIDTEAEPPKSVFRTTRSDPANAELHEATTKAEAFDFLANLHTRYTNAHPSHQIALTGLLNTVEDMGALYRHGRDHCPLHAVNIPNPSSLARNQHPLPYATNTQLIKHANDVLERLDHEFSAEGGILGMLPLPEDHVAGSTETNLLGQRSVLGQWIAFTRSLVTRNHELEQNLAAALEIVSGEAIIPKQVHYDTTTDDKMLYYNNLREKADNTSLSERFIINIQQSKKVELEKAFVAAEEQIPLPGGPRTTSGVWGKDLIDISVTTTYSRLRGGTTIFITPTAIEPKPPLSAPIQLVKGEWRDRSSVWELTNNDEFNRLKRLEREHEHAIQEHASRKEALDVLMLERKVYLLAGGGVSGRMGVTPAAKARLVEHTYKQEIAQDVEAYEADKVAFQAEKMAFAKDKRAFEQEKRAFAAAKRTAEVVEVKDAEEVSAKRVKIQG